MLSASSQIGVLDAQVRLAKKLFWISLRSQYPHEREDVETYARGPRPVGREILPSRDDLGKPIPLRPGRSPGLRLNVYASYLNSFLPVAVMCPRGLG
jgi:hypothetical protein